MENSNQYNISINYCEANDIIAKLKSIAHPMRLEIVRCLSLHVKLSVSEIQNFLKIPQPIVSYHLSKLKESKVVDCEKDGKCSFHFLNNGPQEYLKMHKHYH